MPRLLITFAIAAALGAFAGWGTATLLASTPPSVELDGLSAPRGLAPTSDGSLLISEVGVGTLLKWDLHDPPQVLSGLFPRLPVSGLEGESSSGLSAAIQTGPNTYYGAVGEGSAKGDSELYRLEPPGYPVPITGQQILGSRPPLPIANPYDLVEASNGDLLVTDSGLNSVLRITPGGKLSTYARLPSVAIPGGQTDAVPTGATLGPDGAMYVVQLTGYPFPEGAANVYRIVDKNGDGDALDPGEVTVYASGFTAATDLAFEADGSLLVTEFSNDMPKLAANLTRENAAELPGLLLRRKPDGSTEVVADNLVGPTGVAVINGRIFVSEEFAGRVVEVGRTPVFTLVDWFLSILAGLFVAAATGLALSRFL